MSSLVKPASTSGKTAPAAAAAAWPGRWSPRSLTLTPSTTVAPSAAASGPSAVHQRRLAAGAAVGAVGHVGRRRPSRWVGTPTQRRSHSSARARQSASSAPASEGDRAVAQSTASRPERVVGHLGQQRRVGAAAEGHDDAPEPAQPPAGRRARSVGRERRWSRCRASAPSTDSTSSSVPTMPV